ncbi:MAG: radical SAM family heme chaperone HemW [Bacillota bacterium]
MKQQIIKNNTAGIYLHIPFCLSKCDYCDFVSFASGNKEEYITALCLDIKQKSEKYPNLCLDTIYLGGGTPSILSAVQVERILACVKEHFEISIGAEITIEVNPKTVDKEKLLAFKNLGINRVSVGVQSFENSELESVSRAHTGAEAKEVLSWVSEIFPNFSIDLMLGLPTSTMKSVFHNVKTALSFSPNHISLYGLQVEEGTVLAKKVENGLQIPREDTLADMFELVENILKENGYSHYEISNFAKTGFESRHNIGYWKLKNYLGIGISAHSLVGFERFYSPSTMAEYLLAVSQNNCEISEETLSKQEAQKEYVMLGLRLGDGICFADFENMFALDFQKEYREPIAKLQAYLQITNTHIAIPEKYFYVSNQIISEFM